MTYTAYVPVAEGGGHFSSLVRLRSQCWTSTKLMKGLSDGSLTFITMADPNTSRDKST